MELIKITFPDGSEKSYPKGTTPQGILKDLGQKLRKQAIAAKINDVVFDLTHPIAEDSSISIITTDAPEGMPIYWHSTSHIMAHAVKALYPDAKFGVGPSIESGFYYDIDLEHSLTPDDLVKIEDKMAEIIKENNVFIRKELAKDNVIKLFNDKQETYKLELLREIDGTASIYEEGGFIDLCTGPHLPSTGYVKHVKLLNIAGAYWRGDEKNPMLQRIYGTAYPQKEELAAHLNRLEEARKRDHRKLGRELDLFSVSEDIGPGLILWHPKGALIRKIMEDFWRDEHLKSGYDLLFSPHIAKLNLWDTSGHLDFFKENMYSSMEIDEIQYQIKPMNCPFHLCIYKSQTRSYRDLPIRWAELGTVYRYERSGVLHGLLRVRGFTQDDAHIFCREDQLEAEVLRLLDFTFFMLRTFGFTDFEVYLSTRPEKFVGTIANWELATGVLQKALETKGIAYEIDPGEGVFYGPKIDIKIKDVLDRSWQCSTIQVDFNEPERFDIMYKGSDGNDHRPIMIHRALLGSLERFFGVMIEHFAGAFPLWLSPVQAIVLPITEKQLEYARQINNELKAANIRSQLDERSEKIGFKIREAELQKIPYMIIIGAKETENNTIAVRQRREGDLGENQIKPFIARLLSEIEQKR
ncbi:threonine--tRNA ligase [candidate division KSB1 bacterium]|nr:threonine--tRNA ligase [candidate division KSB1 bacterium]